MRCPLYLHGREADSFFELLGKAENDITASMGWVLSRSERFRTALLNDLRLGAVPHGTASVHLQESAATEGYTDIEIQSAGLHCIIEAKRGWNLPTEMQLAKYVGRFADMDQHLLLVISECSPDYAGTILSTIPVVPTPEHRSWQQIRHLAYHASRGAGIHERRLLREFADYLRKGHEHAGPGI